MADRFTVTKSYGASDPLQSGERASNNNNNTNNNSNAVVMKEFGSTPGDSLATEAMGSSMPLREPKLSVVSGAAASNKIKTAELPNEAEAFANEHHSEEQPFVITIPSDRNGDHLYLYRDDFEQQKVTSFLQSLTNYDLTVPRASDAEKQSELLKKRNAPNVARMGTLIGVYLPCVQNIFGVLLFIRLAWIMGTAGWLHGMAIVGLCCACTLLTAISLSAVATNGKVPAGGPYFLISRSLGPEFGGAVGLLFYLGTTAAGGMYVIGAVEIFLSYIASELRIFDDEFNNYRLYGTILLMIVGFIVYVGVRMVNKFAVVSLACVLISVLAIYIGIFVNFNGKPNLHMCVWDGHPLILRCIAGGNQAVKHARAEDFCSADNQFLYALACHQQDGIDISSLRSQTLEYNECFLDPERVAARNVSFNSNRRCYNNLREELRLEQAIPGLTSGVFFRNIWPSYAKDDRQFLTEDESTAVAASDNEAGAKKHENEIHHRHATVADQFDNKHDDDDDESSQLSRVLAISATSFLLFFGIYFPSVTGILAGSNRSGDLADAQKSIPLGTIAATTSTSIVYITLSLLFTATTHPLFLRDKFGESVGGSLVAAELVPFTPWIIFIGACLSTVGAGLQSLTGAPRLLQAIAKDDVIPALRVFTKLSKSGEPTRALLLTLCIALCVVLIGNIDSITPVVTMFFLMCYAFVNLACALQSLLRNPNWRPRFRYYHWMLSILGVALCFFIMFIASWIYAIVAICIAIGIYKYIELKGAEKEWGDGIRGLALASARHWLLRLEDGPVHTKNWRPQILVLTKLDGDAGDAATTAGGADGDGGGGGNVRAGSSGDLQVKSDNRIFDFASQLKAGRGLTVVVSVLEGDIKKPKCQAQAESAKQVMRAEMRRLKMKGFADVLVTRNVCEGLKSIIQTSGLGGLRHNTVIATWPSDWRGSATPATSTNNDAKLQLLQDDGAGRSHHNFCEILRTAHAMKCAVLIPKGLPQFPTKLDRLAGTIDVWWIVHDGGLLMLLPFLLKQTKVWKNCAMRIFTVAQMEDNTIQLKRDLENFVYQLRLDATAEVVELSYGDISAYTYERTLIMEQRHKLLRGMRLSKGEQSTANVQDILDKNRSTPHKATRVKITDNVQLIRSPTEEGSLHVSLDTPTHGNTPKVSNASLAKMRGGGDDVDRDIAEEDEDDEDEDGENGSGSDYDDEDLTTASENGSPLAVNAAIIAAATSSTTSMPNTNNAATAAVAPPTATRRRSTDERGLGGGRRDSIRNKVDAANVRRMHTAVRLNEIIMQRSMRAQLVILNLPAPPKVSRAEENYMEFVEVLTEGLDRVLLLRGGGREVITIYS